jgi:hypothetical protein
MTGVKAVYEIESDLVKEFQNIISNAPNAFEIIAVAPEFNYVEGKVDLIAKNSNGDLVAFEAKLFRWRNALNQAYRNSSFAHYSYVVLPELPRTTLGNLINCIDEFHRRGVGLCFFDSSGIKVEIPATRRSPIQPWLTNTAMSYIDGR